MTRSKNPEPVFSDACDAPQAATESCNDLDDDCDGKTDETGPGVCDDGTPCTYDNCVSGKCQSSVPTVTCGGYKYPRDTTVSGTSCTGWFKSCTGTRQFRVVGCYSSTPGNNCPSGYTVATLMLIGQWAKAANITRYYKNTVCMWTGGSSAGSACGGSHRSLYCWPKGTKCYSTCPSNCCPPNANCGASGGTHPAPLLCVK